MARPQISRRNFRGWLSNLEIRESFLLRKFPAIRYDEVQNLKSRTFSLRPSSPLNEEVRKAWLGWRLPRASLVPRLSLSFSHFFSRARILYAKNRRRGRAWYGTAPTRGHLAMIFSLVLVAMHSIIYSTTLALPSGPH